MFRRSLWVFDDFHIYPSPALSASPPEFALRLNPSTGIVFRRSRILVPFFLSMYGGETDIAVTDTVFAGFAQQHLGLFELGCSARASFDAVRVLSSSPDNLPLVSLPPHDCIAGDKSPILSVANCDLRVVWWVIIEPGSRKMSEEEEEEREGGKKGARGKRCIRERQSDDKRTHDANAASNTGWGRRGEGRTLLVVVKLSSSHSLSAYSFTRSIDRCTAHLGSPLRKDTIFVARKRQHLWCGHDTVWRAG